MLLLALVVLAQNEPPPLPARAAEPAPLSPPPAPPVVPPMPTTSFVRIRCPQDCSVRASGGAGRRVNAQLWEFSDVPAGKTRFDIEGFATMPLAAGYLDIPASSDIEVLVSKGRLTLGTVIAKAATPPPAPGTAVAVAPSTLRVSCQKPCTVLVDGQRKTGENQQGQLTISNVSPGTRQVYVKFLSSSAQLAVDVPEKSEVFLFASDGAGGLRITNTKPLP